MTNNPEHPADNPEHPAALTPHEAFDAMHDGALIIDPDKTALALFVMPDGTVRVKSPHGVPWVVATLRVLIEQLEKR